MRKFIISVIFLSLIDTSFASEIKVQIADCGPLARENLGVVFSLKPHGSGKAYFAKGRASEVCPKLTAAKYVIGYEEDYCDNHRPLYEKECGVKKVFVIKEYVLE